MGEWHYIQVVTITEFDPARTGWGLAQNAKIRKHAVALSVMVPLLLDKRGGKCESGDTCENEFAPSFCTMAAAKRPPHGEEEADAEAEAEAEETEEEEEV